MVVYTPISLHSLHTAPSMTMFWLMRIARAFILCSCLAMLYAYVEELFLGLELHLFRKW